MRTISIITATLLLAATAIAPTAAATHSDSECTVENVAAADGAEGIWINTRAIADENGEGEGVLYVEDNGLNGLQTVNTRTCGHDTDIRVDEDPAGAIEALIPSLPP